MTAPLQSIVEPTAGSLADAGSVVWLRALSGTASERDEAIERLHELLLRAARFEVDRRRAGAGEDAGDLDDLAVQAAADALIAVMGKLHTYCGSTRFTTWACKFAVLEAAVQVRRRSWRWREVPHAEASKLDFAVRDAIAEVLTPQQRGVLVAIALDDVPIDVLAEWWGTTRCDLYKTLQQARRKLRAELTERRLSDDVSELDRRKKSRARRANR